MAESAKRKDWIMCVFGQVREILKVSLGIARDVPILRVKRAHTGAGSYFFVWLFLCSRYVMLFAPFLKNTCPVNVGIFVNASSFCLIIISICLFQFVSLVPWCSLMALFLHVFCDLPVVSFFTTLVWAGNNVRGAKPVTVYFGKYEDKEEVLRQVNCHECPQLPKWVGEPDVLSTRWTNPNLELISFKPLFPCSMQSHSQYICINSVLIAPNRNYHQASAF